MNQSAYADSLFNNDNYCVVSTASFSYLAQNAVWGARLNINDQVVATHHELALLRQCSEHALGNPDRVVHVISSYTQQQVYYLVKTLMHFGISCGKIIIRRNDESDDCPDGIWLFVEDV